MMMIERAGCLRSHLKRSSFSSLYIFERKKKERNQFVMKRVAYYAKTRVKRNNKARICLRRVGIMKMTRQFSENPSPSAKIACSKHKF